MQESREHQTFHVGVKAFFQNEEGKLLVLQDEDGLWELPGGRTEKTEIRKSLQEILAREVAEELGNDIQYETDNIFHAWIRKPEPKKDTIDQEYQNTDFCILLVGFMCTYKSGDIHISSEHQNFKWITQEELNNIPFENTYKQAVLKYFEIREKYGT